MTNDVNHNPANDFPIGRLRIDSVEDTEGHVRLSAKTDPEAVARVEEADTEGHLRLSAKTDPEAVARVEEADTEGHVRL